MLPSAYGLGQYFQDLGHSFSPYGPPSQQITYISFTLWIFRWRIFDRRDVLYALGNDKVENDQPPEAVNVLYWFEKVPYLLCWKRRRALLIIIVMRNSSMRGKHSYKTYTQTINQFKSMLNIEQCKVFISEAYLWLNHSLISKLDGENLHLKDALSTVIIIISNNL